MRDVRECSRIKSVLLTSEGWSVSSIAQALKDSESSINSYLSDYLKQEKFIPKRGIRKSRLNDEQARQFALQPYSKNLNPIDILRKVLSIHAQNYEYFVITKEFRQKINYFLYEALPSMSVSLISITNDYFKMLKPTSLTISGICFWLYFNCGYILWE